MNEAVSVDKAAQDTLEKVKAAYDKLITSVKTANGAHEPYCPSSNGSGVWTSSVPVKEVEIKGKYILITQRLASCGVSLSTSGIVFTK